MAGGSGGAVGGDGSAVEVAVRFRQAVGHALRRLIRVSEGRIVEHEVIWDQMTLLGQLGATPPTGS